MLLLFSIIYINIMFPRRITLSEFTLILISLITYDFNLKFSMFETVFERESTDTLLTKSATA